MSIERLDGPGDLLSSSPLSLPASELLHTPRLDGCEIDSSPFSHNFSDLLDGLGLLAEKTAGDESPDVSYYLENITNIKDIMPDWQYDEIEEIVVMSPKRPLILPTIKEDRNEIHYRIAPAVLADFSFDDQDRVSENATYRRCIRRATGVVYALKRARSNLGSTIRERSILDALAEMSVPFVTRLQWAFQDGEQSYWVIDHYDKGSLLEYVERHGPLDSVRTVFYASEVIVALSGLHEGGIVFQGLNPRNILFDSDGHVLLSDFSHADFEASIEQCGMPRKSLAAVMPEYIAPETVLGWARNAAADWWSFGALVYFMVFGTHPFEKLGNSADHICDRIVKIAIPPDSLRFISPTARDLISKCLQRNPAVRLTMDKIKQHSYFSLVDWHLVSSKRMNVPSVPVSTSIALTRESQRNRFSLQAPPIPPDLAIDSDPRRCFSSSNNLQRRQSIVNVISQKDVSTQAAAFKPAVKILVPSIVAEEDEAISESETSGCVAPQEGLDRQPDIHQKAERMAHFWNTLDKEEGCSMTSQEFGELGTRAGKTPKLRKHRSSIHPRHLRFNFSTSSFQLRLKRKPRSTGALRDPIPKPTPEAADLPIGIHQVGSGIGFTYNIPAQVPSKLSVRSFAPSCGQNFFQGGFSVKNFGRGFTTRKLKAKSASNSSGSVVTSLPAMDQESLAGAFVRPLQLREAGSGTFIRDMYRTPSWILSPPDCLPSPMALVTGGVCDSISPQTSSEPLTPATLVNIDIEGDDEVNISIPKDLDLEYVSNGALSLAPGSTLRLVPQSAAGLSFVEDVDTSLFSCISTA